MLRSVNPTWAEPKMKPRGAEKLFKSVTKYVESRMQRGAEVEIAQVGPACDGMAALNFLADVGCCTSECPPSSGPFVLANRKHGIPTLLSAAIARPFAGMSGEPTIVSNVMSGAGLSGRFFVDVAGNLFEGRNYSYHAGRRIVRQRNGTPINHAPLGSQVGSLVAGDISTGWGFYWSEGAPHPVHLCQRWNGTAWVDHTSRTQPIFAHEVSHSPRVYKYFAVGPSPHFCRSNAYGWLEPLGTTGYMPNFEHFDIPGPGYAAEDPLISRGFIGRCGASGGGYRPSDFVVAAIEGYSPSAQIWQDAPHFATDYEIWLTFRHPITNELLAHKRLNEVEGYAATFTARNASIFGPAPWRAGVQVRPAPDGTWIVSVIDGSKAWVYELVAPTYATPPENLVPNSTFNTVLDPWNGGGTWVWSEDGAAGGAGYNSLHLTNEIPITPGRFYEFEIVFSSPPSAGGWVVAMCNRNTIARPITGDTGPLIFIAPETAGTEYETTPYVLDIAKTNYPATTATIRSVTLRAVSSSYRVNLLEEVTLPNGSIFSGAARVVYL